ncbi:MAG TPA: YhdT family protein [Firmicutes bacterium]|nr:YhdT family protein [Bacillota bacterium]
MRDNDPRYAQSTKEALIGLTIFVLNFVWWFGFGYGMGSGSPANYTYVLGFPSWFFWSCIMGFVVFSVVVWLAVKYFFKEMPLDSEGVKADDD